MFKLQVRSVRGLALVVLSAVLFAQSAAKAATHVIHSTQRAVSNASEDTVPRETGNPILLQVGPGFISGNYDEGISVNAGAVIRVSETTPVYVGVDTMFTLGTNYSYLDYGYYNSVYTGSSVGLGILATGYYKYTFPRKQQLHIVGGLSTGPFIGGGRIALALLIRPGFTYDFNETVSVTGEPMFGVIGSGFVAMPRAMFSFKI